MTVADEQPRTLARAHSVAVVAAALTFVNLLALHMAILLVQANYLDPTEPLAVQEIWYPIMGAAWGQAVVNGLILFVWKRAREVGAGILLGALAIALVVCVLLIIVIATLPYP